MVEMDTLMLTTNRRDVNAKGSGNSKYRYSVRTALKKKKGLEAFVLHELLKRLLFQFLHPFTLHVMTVVMFISSGTG